MALAGTAEVPLGGLYMDQILDEGELPVKMVAFGHCFRTEAGSLGVASKGLYRLHQFSKIEMFVISTPRQSEALLEELVAIEEELFTQLGLHFKVWQRTHLNDVYIAALLIDYGHANCRFGCSGL